ncbi:MAG: MarR family transcriptional regulator, partial [Caldilinea sp.]
MGKDQLRTKARRLIAAANELLAIAHELESSDGDARADDFASAHSVKDSPVWAEIARATYRDRRRRADIFADLTLFGEPAWDI